MNSNISYLFQLYGKKIKKYSLDNYHPYLECYLDNDIAYVNRNIAIKNKKIQDEYINKVVYYEYLLNTNRLRIFFNGSDSEYILKKYELKLKYTNDYIYIFKCVLNEIFPSNIVYFDNKNKAFIIYLDYEKTCDNILLIKKVFDIFLPLNYNGYFTFFHILKLDIKEIFKFKRWFIL